VKYPGLHAATDSASLRAQRFHFIVIRLQLGLFFLVAITAGLAAVLPSGLGEEIAVLTAILLAIAILTAWIGRLGQYERAWFTCRAIAESVKSASWLYMMRVPPFEHDATADSLLANRLREILSVWSGYEKLFAGRDAGHSPTSKMRDIRNMDFAERKSQYSILRQKDQRDWYSDKCRLNESRATQWFWITTILPVAALVVAIGQARFGPAPVNLISPLMTLAATFLAWSQSKRYEELSQAYSLAAVELEHLQALTMGANNEESLHNVVVDTEEAISREHKMWCVKRSIKTPG
jgi:hypothetical protein